MTPQSTRWRGALLALVHFAFVGAIGLHLTIPLLFPNRATDFSTFYHSALEARSRDNPYPDRAIHALGESGQPLDLEGPGNRDSQSAEGNLNPPFLVALMVPLSHLPYVAAFWIWYGLSMAAGVVAGFLMAGTWLPHRPHRVWGPLFAAAILLFYPSLANAWTDQLGLLLALLSALTFWLLARERAGATGAALGIAAGLKLFVGLFGILFLLTRRWRALAGFAVALAATVLVGGLALGWQAYPQYVHLLGQVDWHSSSWNVSVFGTATRLIGARAGDGGAPDLASTGLGVARVAALALGIAYGTLLISRVQRTPDPVVLRVAVSLTFVMMLLLSPLGWLYYFPALLPSCAALVTSAHRGGARKLCISAVVAFVALSSVPQRLYRPGELGLPGYSWWKSELPMLALLILASAHVWLLGQTSRRSTEPARVAAAT